MTRIIAGTFGGRQISVPSRGTRPTTDRVREALFSTLEARLDFEGLDVLDLYAGSGGLGLESLSRGASSAVFIDSSRQACETITKNIHQFHLVNTTVYHAEVKAALAQRLPVQADLVFLDPPYTLASRYLQTVIELLVTYQWVSPYGVVVLERARDSHPFTWPDGWEKWFERSYGGTYIEIVNRRKDEV